MCAMWYILINTVIVISNNPYIDKISIFDYYYFKLN